MRRVLLLALLALLAFAALPTQSLGSQLSVASEAEASEELVLLQLESQIDLLGWEQTCAIRFTVAVPPRHRSAGSHSLTCCSSSSPPL